MDGKKYLTPNKTIQVEGHIVDFIKTIFVKSCPRCKTSFDQTNQQICKKIGCGYTLNDVTPLRNDYRTKIVLRTEESDYYQLLAFRRHLEKYEKDDPTEQSIEDPDEKLKESFKKIFESKVMIKFAEGSNDEDDVVKMIETIEKVKSAEASFEDN